jgi:hypothetical protein
MKSTMMALGKSILMVAMAKSKHKARPLVPLPYGEHFKPGDLGGKSL